MQRALMLACAVICLTAALHGPEVSARRWYAALLLLMALAGAVTAAEQVWLQTASMDDLVPVIASVERGLDTLSLHPHIDQVYTEINQCAEINWSLFGMSLPEWSLLAFSALSLFALWPLCSGWRRVSSMED